MRKTVYESPHGRYPWGSLHTRAPVRLFVLVVCAVILGGTYPPGRLAASEDKSFSHPLIEQVYRFLPDGTVEVEEIRSFSFKGSFTWATLNRETRGAYGRYGIDYLGVWDAETNEKLRSEQSMSAGYANIKWHYQARNTTRRFLIRYRIRNAVQRYGDVAQFYWKAIEDRHARIDRVEITLIPPSPSPGLFKVFIHGKAAPGTLEFPDDFGRAHIGQSRIPKKSFMEVRALFDPALFHDVPVQSGETYESILADERRITETARHMVMKFYGAIMAGIVIFVAIVGIYIYFYIRYGTEPKLSYDSTYEREPPRDLPPAVLPAILTQSGVKVQDMTRGFAATLLECARLGYLEIGEEKSEGFLGIFKNTLLRYTITEKGIAALEKEPIEHVRGERPLEPFEKDVLRTVIREAGDGKTATTKEIVEWGSDRTGKKTNFLAFIEPRGKLLRKWFEKNYFKLDDDRSEKAKGWFVGIALLAGVCIILMFIFLVRTPILIIIGIATIVFGVIAAIPLARRTPEAALEHERWNAFKKFMIDFSAMKEAGPGLLQIWDSYLVYATALGVADKLLKNLKNIAIEYSSTVPVVAWYHPAVTSSKTSSLGQGFSSLESLTSSISNMQALSSALSSSTSTGGGFSGGGGGGGGGGCSGAG